MAKTRREQASDPIALWLREANQDFFRSIGAVEPATVMKALTGFIVFAMGLTILITQII